MFRVPNRIRPRTTGLAGALLLALGTFVLAPRAAAAPTAPRTEIVFLALSGLT